VGRSASRQPLSDVSTPTCSLTCAAGYATPFLWVSLLKAAAGHSKIIHHTAAPAEVATATKLFWRETLKEKTPTHHHCITVVVEIRILKPLSDLSSRRPQRELSTARLKDANIRTVDRQATLVSHSVCPPSPNRQPLSNLSTTTGSLTGTVGYTIPFLLAG
jgi:hypothetical protein